MNYFEDMRYFDELDASDPKTIREEWQRERKEGGKWRRQNGQSGHILETNKGGMPIEVSFKTSAQSDENHKSNKAANDKAKKRYQAPSGQHTKYPARPSRIPSSKKDIENAYRRQEQFSSEVRDHSLKTSFVSRRNNIPQNLVPVHFYTTRLHDSSVNRPNNSTNPDQYLKESCLSKPSSQLCNNFLNGSYIGDLGGKKKVSCDRDQYNKNRSSKSLLNGVKKIQNKLTTANRQRSKSPEKNEQKKEKIAITFEYMDSLFQPSGPLVKITDQSKVQNRVCIRRRQRQTKQIRKIQ